MGLIASMYLGNAMLLAVNIFCIPAFASIARVPFRLLGPIIVLLCAFGTFAVNKSLLDVQIMLACGVLGFFMRRYGLSPPRSSSRWCSVRSPKRPCARRC